MPFHHLYVLMKFAHNYSRAPLKELGISSTEHLICTFITGHPNSSQDQISEFLQFDKTTTAKALASLEKKGYIRREINPDNRRKNVINVTESGSEMLAPVLHVYDYCLKQLSHALTEEEWKAFDGYLGKILHAAKELNQEVSQ